MCVCVGGKSGCLFVRYSTGGRCSLSNLKLTFKEAAAKIRGVQTRVYGICMYVYVRGCMYPCINMCLCIHGHSVCVYIWKIINNITVHTGTANVHGIVLFLCFLASCCIVVRSCLCICMRVRVRVRVCVKRLTKRRVCCFSVVSVAKSRKRKVDD